MKDINDDAICEFISEHLRVEDFGYLVATDDARLNAEALSNIKQGFREFIENET